MPVLNWSYGVYCNKVFKLMRGEFFAALVITPAIYGGVHAQRRVALERHF